MRVDEAVKERFQAAATAAGLSMTEWIEQTLLASLEEPGEQPGSSPGEDIVQVDGGEVDGRPAQDSAEVPPHHIAGEAGETDLAYGDADSSDAGRSTRGEGESERHREDAAPSSPTSQDSDGTSSDGAEEEGAGGQTVEARAADSGQSVAPDLAPVAETEKIATCPRAASHRPGRWCKWCRRFIKG